MFDPTTLTAADLAAFLDGNPAAEAEAILNSAFTTETRRLDHAEIRLCGNVMRGDPLARAEFPALRDRIMLRWSTSARPATEAHTELSVESEGTVAGPAGAVAPAVPALSSATTRRQAPDAAAGLAGIRTEWTLTIRRPR